MRIDLKEKNHFLTVFEAFFDQSINRPINGISIDSRNIKKNDLFIAIKGENFDGNDFVDQAIQDGASYTLSSYENESSHHLLVEDLNVFIKELLINWLKSFNGRIVGITGSNGKTTTKDLIAHLLQSKFKVEKTLGNYNTSISVPLSILSFALDSEIYVLELGANKVGDIEYLSSIVKPDYGVITSIAAAHLDGFGSIENIEKEKKSILNHSAKKFNFHETKPNSLAVNFKENKSNIFIKNLEIASHVANDIFNDSNFPELNGDLLINCLESFKMPPGRGEIFSLNNFKIIDDSYNANPESVKAALDHLSGFKECRKFFVFGDMKELGANEEIFHKKIGQYAVEKADILLTVGKLAKNAQSNSNNFALSLHFNDNFSLLEKLNELLTDGDIVLIKGSRSMQLDQLINELKMLNELLLPLREYFGFLNLFEYITFRAGASAILALLISFIFGPFVVKKLINLQIGESIRDHGPDSHKEKQGTPTMGGVLIILSTIIPTVLLADLNNLFIQIICISMVWMGLIGFYDDYLKVVKKRKDGLSGRYKLLAQTILGVFISYILISSNVYGDYTLLTFVPFLKNVSINFFYPIIYAVFIILVVSATSNAVNLTDGLDGLAAGLLAISVSVFGVIAYISGRVDFTDYLYIAYLPLASELTIFATAFFGGCLGFLWFNAKPAEIFMGDVGSLSTGAALGTLAILLKKEVLLLIVGGVFVIETLSVIIQVLYFRYTKNKYGTGKKFFLMAPIHHHFELKGWPESRVVTRFWIIGILFALMSLTTFKVR